MTVTATSEAPAAAGQPRVTVLVDRCAGCQECVIRCPVAALSMDAAQWIAVADDALCVGCRQCERTCPFSAIIVSGPILVAAPASTEPAHPVTLAGDNSEVRRGFASWEEALAEANRCLDCPDPTCVRGCPAHNDIPSFVRAIRDGDLAGAHSALSLTSVLPDMCSRVCDQAAQCEGACTWSLAGGAPVAIGKLERFVADEAPVPPPWPQAAGVGLSVGIVGSGPAGIGAAWRLVGSGATVTVYERDAAPGGLPGWGIPEFALPAAVAARPWQQLAAAGVQVRCGTGIGPEDVQRLLTEHDAVLLAHGAGTPLRLPVPGADLVGVTDATWFLKTGRAALAHGISLNGSAAAAASVDGNADLARLASLVGPATQAGRQPRVLVLGAGNTAMDVARTARRLGLAATCVDWVDERFAIARPDELAEARHEGVQVLFLRTVSRLEGEDGRVCRAVLTPTSQARADARPKPARGAAEIVAADLVVMAMGYRVDPQLAALAPGTPVARRATGVPDRQWLASGIMAGPDPAQASGNLVGRLALGRESALAAAAVPVNERVWVAGDALSGPSTVVEAMAQGQVAAESILRSRPGRDSRPGPMQVLVAYESRGGRTADTARMIASALRESDAIVRAVPLGQVGWDELRDTDLLVLGTWVEGLVVARVGPAQATRSWLDSLPRVAGLRTAAFCTFAVAPRDTLATIRRALTERGAIMLAEQAFRRGSPTMAADAAAFAAELLRLVSPRDRQPAG
jgi:glutamate synthase (NADPH) small chain